MPATPDLREWLALLLEREASLRHDKRLATRLHLYVGAAGDARCIAATVVGLAVAPADARPWGHHGFGFFAPRSSEDWHLGPWRAPHTTPTALGITATPDATGSATSHSRPWAGSSVRSAFAIDRMTSRTARGRRTARAPFGKPYWASRRRLHLVRCERHRAWIRTAAKRGTGRLFSDPCFP